MPQLTLFHAAALAADSISHRRRPAGSSYVEASSEAGTATRVTLEPRRPTADTGARGAALERPDPVQIDFEAERILDALHCETHDGFLAAVEPLMTADERRMTRLARGLSNQLALAYDRIVDRLTLRWSELNQWPVFGRIVEPGVRIGPTMRVCTIELVAPSRNLAGRVAFSVQRDLARVGGPIPAPVLRCISDTWESTFAALAYLEPLYSTRREAGERRLLRSIAEVRRHYAEPIDPLIVGWLGGGPRNYGLPGLVGPPAPPAPPARHASQARHSSLGEIVFLLGHWD